MRGAVAVTGSIHGFTVVQGADKLATYRFNTRTAEHHFCTVCGIYTHHKRRSNPNQLGVNVACLDGVSPFDFREVVVHDGEAVIIFHLCICILIARLFDGGWTCC